MTVKVNKKTEAKRQATQKRYEKVVRLRNSGLSFQEIGELVGGISKQRVWQIYRRALKNGYGRDSNRGKEKKQRPT